jgi:hypothetical protein
MPHKSPLTLVLTFGLLLGTTAIVGAVNDTKMQPVATIVTVEGATTTYHSQDWNGQTVTVQEPSHSAEDVKGRDTHSIVRATVTAIDPTIHHVKVKTSEGQTIVLDMPPTSIMSMQVGDPLTFTLPAPRP